MRFTPGELRVMKLLWEHGELTPPQMLERFPEPIKDPALRSYLKILVDKGHVQRTRIGKAYAYTAVTPQQHAFGAMVSQLADAFGDGSVRSLILNLAKHEKLTSDDLDEIRQAAGFIKETKSPSVKKKRTVKRKRTSKKGGQG